MNKIFFCILFFALAAYAQQKVAILNTEDDGEPPIKYNELRTLTNKLRSIAMETLPRGNYEIMTEQTIQSFLGSQKEMEKVCRKADGCLAKIGRDIEADYIGQARISRFGKLFTINVDVYDVKKGTLAGNFTDESSKDIHGLLKAIEKKSPDMFNKMQGAAVAAPIPVTTLPAPVTQTPVTTTVTATSNIFTDSRDGKQYRTVKIVNLVWMAENLNYNANGSKCYDNREANCEKYGRLYDWATANKACPSGWHLPSNAEWDYLINAAGGEKTAGKKLKAKSGWISEDKLFNGTDEFGFAALPGGDSDGLDFLSAGNEGEWWSSSESYANYAYSRGMDYYSEGVYRNNNVKDFLFSIRCLQD